MLAHNGNTISFYGYTVDMENINFCYYDNLYGRLYVIYEKCS